MSIIETTSREEWLDKRRPLARMETEERGRERFLSMTEVDVNGCWVWQGCIGPGGYGRFKTQSISRTAHRWAYALFRGGLQDGMVIDHLCRNRACVNPDHLEQVTQAENVRRGLSGELKTHCKRRHLLPAERNSTGRRVCKTCKQIEWQRRRDADPDGFREDARLRQARYRARQKGAEK